MSKTLLTIGQGYTADALAARLAPKGWRLFGTTRTEERMDTVRARGVTPLLWPDVKDALARATHLLMCAAPSEGTDPFLAEFGSNMAELAPNLAWAGYLSTTGVYGDHAGAWVDEDTPLAPTTARGKARAAAEAAWQDIGLPLHIFRLSGIYGPGKSALDRIRNGTAKRIIKEGQVFSRIHVEDIAQALEASMAQPSPGSVYNLADDDPAPPQDVIEYAAELLGTALPPAVPFDEAELSPMARSFYSESKRVRADRVKAELGIDLLYPDYRSGLEAILAAEQS